MEIVINKCFGGFSLSNKAEDLYAEKKGFKLYRYEQTKYVHSDSRNEYKKLKDGEVDQLFILTYTKDLGDTIDELPEGSFWWSNNIERTDPTLIEVVKELGSLADGGFAKLEVVDIPNDIEWEISEYDGIETVHEKHRSW